MRDLPITFDRATQTLTIDFPDAWSAFGFSTGAGIFIAAVLATVAVRRRWF